MMSKKNKIIIFSLAAIILIGFFFFFHTVAVVGDLRISAKDVSYRNKVNKIFYPNDPNDYGKEQLITAFTYAQILKNNGVEISDKVLKEEEARIDQNTKAPDVLEKIKKVYGNDKESYQKDFVLPTYAERTIYFDFFNKSKKAQAKSLAKVNDFLLSIAETKKPLSFLAQEQGYTYKKFEISKENGIEWENPKEKKIPHSKLIDKSATTKQKEVQQSIDEQSHNQAQESANFWIDNVISRMTPGQIVQEPVDNGENWMVVKYLKNLGKKTFEMEAILIPKDSYEEWLKTEKAKIKVR
jgi:hypothetical protein